MLTNEIRRFYTVLKKKVISELKKREEKRKARQAMEQAQKEQPLIQEESVLREGKE